MRTKSKWAAAIGVVACVGAALWMRELASWRPVLVAKVGLTPTLLRFSRDGRFLLVEDEMASSTSRIEPEGVVLDAQNGFAATSKPFRNFDGNPGAGNFPRLSFDARAERVIFIEAPGKKVVLHGLGIGRDIVGIENGKSSFYSWSKARREVYAGFMGDIYVWDWEDGKLKRRVRTSKNAWSWNDQNQLQGKVRPVPADFSRCIFSPDGKWMVVAESTSPSQCFLRRYDTRNGEEVLLAQKAEINAFGFSPDGQFIWSIANSWEFVVNDAPSSKVVWRTQADCAAPVKWLAGNRVGLITRQGFEIHDAAGLMLRNLPGPFQRTNPIDYVSDWTLSPDGKWIYSAEQSGVIRRWRAR